MLMKDKIDTLKILQNDRNRTKLLWSEHKSKNRLKSIKKYCPYEDDIDREMHNFCRLKWNRGFKYNKKIIKK